MRQFVPLLVICTLLLATGCRARTADQDEAGVEPTDVSLAVTTAPARVAPMAKELRLLGTTVAPRRVTIRAAAAGRISELKLQTGDRVVPGAPIARIVTREDEAVRAGLAAAQDLDPSEATAIKTAMARQRHPGLILRAPEGGVISQRFVSDGQLVNDFDPLLEMIDPASIFVEASAPINVLDEIKPAMSALVTSPLHPGAAYPATVVALSPSFTPSSATVPVRLAFTEAKRISEAGASVEIRITTSYVPEAVVVPASAVFQDPEHGTTYLFVVGSDRRAHRTTVETGLHNLEQVQIVRGLEPGRVVITSGGYALSDGLAVRPIATERAATR